MREIRLRWIAEGRCLHCREPRGGDGTRTLCRHCMLKLRERNKEYTRKGYYRERWRRRVTAGLCGTCGKSRGDSKSSCLCIRCLAKDRKGRSYYPESAKIRRDKFKKQGICISCTQHRKTEPGYVHCIECRKLDRERNKRKNKDRLNRGLCVRCGKDRGKSPSTWHCADCFIKTKKTRELRQSNENTTI